MEICFNTMNTLTPEHLLKTVYIRGEAHTVMQAIERQISLCIAYWSDYLHWEDVKRK